MAQGQRRAAAVVLLLPLGLLGLLGGAAAFSAPGSGGLAPPSSATTVALSAAGAASAAAAPGGPPTAPAAGLAAAAAAIGFAAALARGARAPAAGVPRRSGGQAGVNARGLLTTRQAGKEYWEGEWICADCGYIYNERAFGSKFEDLQAGFKCPQCSAPRRRFARKLGDKIGTTLDGGDTPILLFSAGALVVVLVIAYFALQ